MLASIARSVRSTPSQHAGARGVVLSLLKRRGLRDGIVGDAVIWESAKVGTLDEQYCSGCGARFRGLITEASRCTKDVYPGRPLGRPCSRCNQLDANNISAASDEARDVKVEDFVACMEGILARGPALCVKIVDATDFEATSIGPILRKLLGEETPVLLAVNKVDLLPRFDEGDLAVLRGRIESQGLPCMSAHAVSAATGGGVRALAAAVAAVAEKRNVIVCGAASVGKSTLINQLAEEVASECAARDEAAHRAAPLTAFEKAVQRMHAEKRATQQAAGLSGGGSLIKSGFSITLREEREEAVGRLRLTESPMPGTTLSAIAIPCLGSWRHHMFDTPGVLVPHALAHGHLLPVHLLAPLMAPEPIRAGDAPLRLRAGESLVLEAAWLEDTDGVMALARVDVCQVEGGDEPDEAAILARPLTSSAVRVRVVPTAEAAAACEVPPAYLERLRGEFVAQGNHADAAALGNGPMRRPLDDEPPHAHGQPVAAELVCMRHGGGDVAQRRALDVAFSNLGWIAFDAPGGRPFAVSAHPVKGSAAWTRPPLYVFDEDGTLC